MKLSDFDTWVTNKLEFSRVQAIDSAINGIQVGQADAEIRRIVFAVDACMDTFRRAKNEGAQAIFVHHGLFWGKQIPVTGVIGERIRFLIKNDIALYACHLPLDIHSHLGNNAQMAMQLELQDIQPFGEVHGLKIGCKGRLAQPMNMEAIVSRLFGRWDERINALRFGDEHISSIGMVSGGGVYEASQAIQEGLDLYITGDSSHNIYHECRESGINILFAGHYLTEIFGVRAMAACVEQDLGLETLFVDFPTGY